jgi:hypothetical protein
LGPDRGQPGFEFLRVMLRKAIPHDT